MPAGSTMAGCRRAGTTFGATGTITTPPSRGASSTSRTSRAGTGPGGRSSSSTPRRPHRKASTAPPEATIPTVGRALPTTTRTAVSRSLAPAIRATYASSTTAGTREAAITAMAPSASATSSTSAERGEKPLPQGKQSGGLRAVALLFVFGVLVVGGVRRLLRRDGDLLGRDLAGNDRDVDLDLVLPLDENRRAGLERAAQDEVRERVLDVALNRAAQRPGAHRRVVTLLDQQLLRLVGQLDRNLVLAHLLAQAAEHQFDDVGDLFLRQLVEDDDLVDAVEQLGPEDLLELAENAFLHVLVGETALVADREAERLILRDRAGADVRGHDHDRVPEVDLAALGVR